MIKNYNMSTIANPFKNFSASKMSNNPRFEVVVSFRDFLGKEHHEMFSDKNWHSLHDVHHSFLKQNECEYIMPADQKRSLRRFMSIQ